MTIRELVADHKEVSFWEVYRGTRMHTDYCRVLEDDEYNIGTEIEAWQWELMDKEEYSRTILANSCINAEEISDFDDGPALIILLEE